MESSNLIKLLTNFTVFVHNTLFRHTFQNFLYIIMETLLACVAHPAHPVVPPMDISYFNNCKDSFIDTQITIYFEVLS
jgi:hypothetical protein